MVFAIPDFRRVSPDEVSPMNDLISKAIQNYTQALNARYLPQTLSANAQYKQAMANYLSNPYQSQRFMTPLGKLLNEQRMGGQASLGGRGGVAQGGQEYQESGYNPYELEIQKTVTDPQQRHQAQAAQIIYNQVRDIDTKPLEKFAGLGGKVRHLEEAAKGVASSFGLPVEPSKEWRNYQSYMAVNKNAIMDAIRQALKTSVVPGYVQSTLAPMVDPTAAIWNDPKQVRQNIETLKKWIKPYTEEQTEAFSRGVPTSVEKSVERSESFKNASRRAESDEASHEDAIHTAEMIGKRLGTQISPMEVLQAQHEGVRTLSQFKMWLGKNHA